MTDEPQVRQEIKPDHDAYTAARDMHVHQYATSADPGPARPVVVGDVPQEPAAFQPRPGLMEALESRPEGRVSVVHAVTGIRGVGKTQVAAAYARRRAHQWRLVAWVDASSENALLAGLTDVADATGIGDAGDDARERAAGVRHWLESDGERRLLVFDNANDLAMVRPFLPAAGEAQVIVTSSRRSAGGLGTPVPVDVFGEDEALAYLDERTGLRDEEGARELAAELGYLPLGLAQAAALIDRQYLDYQVYLERLRSRPVADYLKPADADEYPYRLAEAIEMSLEAVTKNDSSGTSGQLMGLVSVLAETGVRRELLVGAAGDARAADEGLGDLTDASLLEFSMDGQSVTAHPLVMRVVRERLAARGGLPTVVDEAARVLAEAISPLDKAWRHPAAASDLAGQVTALTDCWTAHPEVFSGQVPEDLLGLRLQSVYLLIGLGDSIGSAIAAAEPLAADCERFLETDHPDALASRNALAIAYRVAGRTAEAIPLYEGVFADRERLLGADHLDTLASRNSLGLGYRDAGRTGKAIPLLEQALADYERLLGTDHAFTLASRNGLATAYRDAGRIVEAIEMAERALAGREQLLGADHLDTLVSDAVLAVHGGPRLRR